MANHNERTINGKIVEDAKRKVRLEVMLQDVKEGDPKQPESCAAALACVRQMHAISAKVNLSRTFVEYYDCWLRYMTPDSLRTEIAAFDRGGKMSPGTHLLKPPPPSSAKGASHSTKAQTSARRSAAKKAKDAAPKRSRAKLTPHRLIDVRRSHIYDRHETK